ncbi:MAG: carboxypeptidase regulatory-like domain-containing protein [Bacteroidetes bacterium]|nr:carboxypeptidase regulatory-like domain-containing protein [Bacteroidota bacterium]
MKLIHLIILVLVTEYATAGEFSIKFDATVKEDKTGEPISGLKILIIGSKGDTAYSQTTDNTGKFEFLITTLDVFQIHIGPTPNCKKKIIELSTLNIPDKHLLSGYSFGGFKIFLLPNNLGIDLSFYDHNPISKIYFSKKYKGFDIDSEYTKSIVPTFNDLDKELDKINYKKN